MPFHGLVRDSAFGVEATTASSATLVRTSCGEWLSDCYPFDFELRLTYALEGGALHLTARIKNRSARPMPPRLWLASLFVTRDKARARLVANMSRCERWDEAGKAAIAPTEVDLDRPRTT
jgi:galactose mutarotase-like enzyme